MALHKYAVNMYAAPLFEKFEKSSSIAPRWAGCRGLRERAPGCRECVTLVPIPVHVFEFLYIYAEIDGMVAIGRHFASQWTCDHEPGADRSGVLRLALPARSR